MEKSDYLNIKSKQLFKLLLWGYTAAYIPFGIIGGLLVVLEVVPVNFNGEPYIGFMGLFISILYFFFGVIILTVTNWLALAFGLFIIKYIRKK